MDWSKEQIMEFLESYKNEPIIWDPSHANHRNWNKHHDAWKRIEMKFGQRYSIRELERKKESLMASFRGLYNKVKHSRRTSSGLGDLYKPTWFAYDKIYSFLKGKGRPKGTRNTDVNVSREETEIKLEGVSVSNSVQTRSLKRGDVNKAAASSRNSNASSKATMRKKRKIPELVNQPETTYASYSILTLTDDEKNVREKDICDIYGELVTAKLRRLDEQSREIAMNRIDNLFFDISMNMGTPHTYNNNSPHYSQRYPSPKQEMTNLANTRAPHHPPNSPSTSSRSSLSCLLDESSASVPLEPCTVSLTTN